MPANISQGFLPNSGNAYTTRFRKVRDQSEALAERLSPEDQQVQSMPDVSPTKWHLAHTSWFFETFILRPFWPGYQVFDESFNFLFNSYYEAVGPRQLRAERGLITRPTLAEVLAYRAHIDSAMEEFFDEASGEQLEALCYFVELGLHHEQRHQELLNYESLKMLERLTLKLSNVTWSTRDLEALLFSFVENERTKFKDVAQPLRVALIGQISSPNIAAVMKSLGREETLNRILDITVKNKE